MNVTMIIVTFFFEVSMQNWRYKINERIPHTTFGTDFEFWLFFTIMFSIYWIFG